MYIVYTWNRPMYKPWFIYYILPYGMKYWWKLYLANSQIFFPRLAGNLADWSRSSTSHVNTHASLAEFNLVVLSYIHQSTKLNSLPIFHAIRYMCIPIWKLKLYYIVYLRIPVWELFAEVLQFPQHGGVALPSQSLLQGWSPAGV